MEPFEDGTPWALPLHHALSLPRGGQEDWHSHDTGLGALAAGLIVVGYVFVWNLPGGIGEAAGGRCVSTNCGGRDRMSLNHSSEEKMRSEV